MEPPSRTSLETASTESPRTGELGARARAAAAGSADRVARAVAKARIASALFARERRATIGRYQLLELVGAGGMGVVWGAWDPELERRVAIKLVQPLHDARERILAEGQALAKLSHPNVIPIFDVGVVGEQVYLVMEWVRGVTLRRFADAGRAHRDLVEVYRQAGAGLAAAHRAGVIHRDFKPDNAVVGEDGRVRVLDFGLAHAAPPGDEAAAATDVAGTPRYMAPEQLTGAALTPAVDQFALCVSLRDALVPLPRWIAAIVERGTAADPARRFPSMDALLAALARDPARVWRRRAVVAAAVVAAGAAAGVAFAVGRASPDAALARCDGSSAELARTWHPGARAAMIAHLRGLGPFGAHEADRLAGELDAYGTAWIGERTRACESHERGELPPALYERRVACLARAEGSLAAVAQLMTTVGADGLGNALVAARMLPSAAGCAADDASAVPPPPAALTARVTEVGRDVERARVLAFAASPDAAAVADAAATAAGAIGYPPLIARARLMQGWARQTADRPAAVAQLRDAFHTALRAGDDVLAVEAYARARWVASRFAGFVPAAGEREIVESVALRTGPTGRFGLALLYNNLASERLVADDRAGARDLLRLGLDARPPAGDRAHDIELIAILRNLALVEDAPARRLELSAQAARAYELELGGDHPSTISARIQEAVLTPDAAEAALKLAATCRAIGAWHAKLIASCAYEEAWLALDRDDAARAAAAMRRVEGDPRDPKRGPRSRIASAYLAIAAGDPAAIPAALRALEELAARLAAQDGWWSRADAADALALVARGAAALGHAADASAAWTRAAALYADQPSLERRRARARAEAARGAPSERPGR